VASDDSVVLVCSVPENRPKKRKIESDDDDDDDDLEDSSLEEDDYDEDEDMSDFIDDGCEDNSTTDYSFYIRKLFNYDRRKLVLVVKYSNFIPGLGSIRHLLDSM
jgi:SPT2 chromatin protein